MTITHGAPGGQRPGQRIPVAGGTCTAVIDLAGGPDEPPYGGHDIRAKQIFYPLRVRGRLRVGHTRSLSDENAPIWVEEQPAARLSGQVADLRCPGCVSRCDIGELDGTLVVIEHQAGCRWLRGMLRRSGRAS
jgi:hypothetical protein